jgi:hypothetical protein
MERYVGKEIVSYAEFKEHQRGPKVQLGGDKLFQRKACSKNMKERANQAKSEAVASCMKKTGAKKKGLSSHRKKAGGGGGGGGGAGDE